MFCKSCGKEFQQTSDSQIRCTSCEEEYRKYPSYTVKEPETCYCITCGKPLQKTTITAINGVTYQKYGNRRQCDICKKTNLVVFRRQGYTPKYHSYRDAHLKAAKKWAEKNPLKVWASHTARYHKDVANIIYECPCEYENKHFHHFDYLRPLDVILLCPACHRAEHERLRNLNKQVLTSPY